MGPSKKKREDAADERRQYAAKTYERAEEADKRADKAEVKKAAEKTREAS